MKTHRTNKLFLFLVFSLRHPATAKWYDKRDSVIIEFCIADSKDVKVNFDKTKFAFRYDALTVDLSMKLYLVIICEKLFC